MNKKELKSTQEKYEIALKELKSLTKQLKEEKALSSQYMGELDILRTGECDGCVVKTGQIQGLQIELMEITKKNERIQTV